MSDEAKTVDEHEATERQWPVTVTLKYPVQFGKDMTIERLEFRRGRLGDMKGIGITVDRMPNADQTMVIASRMCGQPLKVLELLDGDDASEVHELVLGFFARSVGAGKTS